MWIAAAAYAAVWFELGAWRYRIFRAAVDDGIFTQVVASAFSGFRATPEWNFDHLATHFSPDLVLLAPVVIAAHSTLALTAAQAVAGALVAPPVFWIARRRLPDTLAVGCAIVALLYPALSAVTFVDFHENGIEPAAVLWTIWAIDARRPRTAFALGLFALGIKEDVAPGIAFGGIAAGAWFARRGDGARATVAFGLATCAVVVFAGYLFVMRPALHAPFPYQQFRYYNGDDPGAGAADAAARARYVAFAFAPVAFVPLFCPPALALAVPGFVEVFASRNPITLLPSTHYAATWIGYVLFGFVLGLAALHRRAPRATALALIASAAVSLYVQLDLDPSTRWYELYRAPNAHDARMQAVLDALPPDASVSAPELIYAHLGFDPNAGVAFGGRYLIVDRTNNDVNATWAAYEAQIPKLIAAGTYRAITTTDGIDVYERTGP